MCLSTVISKKERVISKKERVFVISKKERVFLSASFLKQQKRALIFLVINYKLHKKLKLLFNTLIICDK